MLNYGSSWVSHCRESILELPYYRERDNYGALGKYNADVVFMMNPN